MGYHAAIKIYAFEDYQYIMQSKKESTLHYRYLKKQDTTLQELCENI